MRTTFYTSTSKLLYIAMAALIFLFSCTKEETIKPVVGKITPGEAAVNSTLTLTGSGLQNIKSIVFDLGNVPVSFNSNFNTETAIIFRIPANANSGDQNIVFTNTSGYQFSVPFRVLPLAVVSSAFPQEWEASNLITLSGSYFETVDQVLLENGGQSADIISKTPTTIVIRMPASTVPSTKLILHNNAGSGTTNIVFINLDLQEKLFTENFGTNVENWSWCDAASSTTVAASGTNSLRTIYDNNEGLSFRRATPFVGSQYTSMSFWIKGGTRTLTMSIKPDAIVSGSGPGTTVTIPPNVWTYFNVPIAGTFDAVTCERFNFQVSGIPAGQETIYFDNVVLIK